MGRFFLLFVVLALFGPARALADSPLELTYTASTLPNGLRIFVVEDHLAPVVETAMYYSFGAYDEAKGKTGLAHALEHMMFRGTPSLDAGGLTDAMSQLGATMNASTLPDYTRFYFIVPAEKLDLALHIEADRMQHLSLTAGDWQLERGAVLTEIIGNAGSPAGRLRKAMLSAAYGEQSRYALDVAGNIPDVTRATVHDLQNYYDRWYAPNNATLVITGDVSPADALRLARKYFSPIPRKKLAEHHRPAPALSYGKVVTLHGDFAFAQATIAYPYVGDVGGPEVDAASLLPSIINNVRSPFYGALVRSGLALSVGASPDTTLHTGLLYVTLIPKPPHTIDEVLSAYNTTLAEFLRTGPSEDVVSAAKEQAATQSIFGRDSIPGLGFLAGYVVGYEGWNDPNRDSEHLAKVTRAAIIAAARKYLARPAVTGEILADGNQPGAATPAPAQITDDFSTRQDAPHHAVAPWVSSAVAAPLVATNRTQPQDFYLPNGMRVLVQTLPVNQTVYVTGSIRFSPTFDPAGKEGTNMLTASLMNFGSAKYDFNERNRIVDELSASVHIGQNFSAYGRSKDFESLVDIVADGVRNPTFPSDYFNLAKSSMLANVERRAHSPEYRSGRALQQMLVPAGDPTLREPSQSSLEAITPADIAAFHRAYIRPDLTTLAVVGDVSLDRVRTVMTKAFGDWSASGPKPALALAQLPLRAGAVAHINTTATTVSVTLAQSAPSRKSPDFYALLVLNEILGSSGEMSSRLMQDLRVKHGLVYSAGSSYSALPYRGIFEFHFSATPENVKPAEALLKSEIARAQTEAPSPEELARAKKAIIGATLINEDSLAGIAQDITNIATNDLPLDYYQTRNARFNAVSADDVLRVARTYLHPGEMAEVYEGPAF